MFFRFQKVILSLIVPLVVLGVLFVSRVCFASDVYIQNWDSCSPGQSNADCDTALFGEHHWTVLAYTSATTTYSSPYSLALTSTANRISDYWDNYSTSTSYLQFSFYVFLDSTGINTTFLQSGVSSAQVRYKKDNSFFDLYNIDGSVLLYNDFVPVNSWVHYFGVIDCSDGFVSYGVVSDVDSYGTTTAYVCPDDFYLAHTKNYTGDVYLDDIEIWNNFDTSFYNNSLDWHFPQDDYILSNSVWNDWGLIYDVEQIYDYMLLGVYYTDSLGTTYYDYDFVSSTTDPTYWTINRSNDLPDGLVYSWGFLIGTNDEACDGVVDDSCTWFDMAESEMISWYASSTGDVIWDFGVTGFTPSTSTLLEFYGASSTDESNFLQETLNFALVSLKVAFPFSIGYNLVEQWSLSENVSIPSSLDFLIVYDGAGNIYLPIDSDIYGTTSILIMGPGLFEQDSEFLAFCSVLRSLSTFALWILFTIGLLYRGYGLYKEYKNI